MAEPFDSIDDKRIANSPMRHQYRTLTDAEKEDVTRLKDAAHEFWVICDVLGSSPELSIAKRKVQEACMWAVNHVTK